MQTPVPVLDPIFEEPQDGSGVSIGEVLLTPEDAKSVLDSMSFERQRDADPTHFGMLADMMINGEFAAGSQLTFAFQSDGSPRLVDGQHRLRAAILADWTDKWNVRVMWNPVQDAGGMYVLLDGYQKRRPPAVIGRALGLSDLHDRMQGVAIATARYQNQWRRDYEPPLMCKFPPIRDNISRVKDRLPHFLEADQILNLDRTSAKARRKMTTAHVLAIMVETLACSPDEEAREFWTAVASNGDGVAGELRDTLIAGKPPRSGALFVPRLVAQAWNNRHGDKLRRDNQRVIKVDRTTLEIPA